MTKAICVWYWFIFLFFHFLKILSGRYIGAFENKTSRD